MQMVTSLLWVLISLAFAFDAVAEPCSVRANLMTEMQHVSAEEMPCHEMMPAVDMAEDHDQSQHHTDTCCCAALLTTIASPDYADLKQPLPGILAWTVPLNDRAQSLPFEYEPPPPRA